MHVAYEFAVLRVVPRVEREEFVNVGILLFCEDRDVVAARLEIDEGRILALWPEVDLPVLRAHLDATDRICRGGAAAGPIGELPARERWRWLVAPRSTILQTSAAHGGIVRAGESIDDVLERLLERLVRVPRAL